MVFYMTLMCVVRRYRAHSQDPSLAHWNDTSDAR